MTQLELLQNYWWFIISVLGAALVFMLFVQGGQTLLYCKADEKQRQLMINSLGSKWELTFTTLVVFGGAFFASFPLFYSTCFGGAYWLWISILISFVLQAVSYEFRRKTGNLYGTITYDVFLMINGFVGCVLLGVAVASFFFGGDFTVSFGNILDGSSPIISKWCGTHGFEMMISWRYLLLGVAVFFLARTLAALYFINNIKEDDVLTQRMRKATLVNGLIFAVLFVAFVIIAMLATGRRVDETGAVVEVNNLYFHNLVDMWWFGIAFVVGVVAVLFGIGTGALTEKRCGIWAAGIGTVLVVISLFGIVGYGGTCYLASVSDPASSLTIANSSSSLYTLKTMTYVSFAVPFVLAYIAYVWRKMK